MADLIHQKDIHFATQLTLLASKLPNYAVSLGITAAELSSLQADALFMNAVAKGATQAKDYAQAWTSLRTRARKGGPGDFSTMPMAVNIGAFPPPVAPGIEKRVRKLVQRIKNSINYSEAIGKDLGIIVPDYTPPMTAPKLSVKLSSGLPRVRFSKGKANGVRIFSKRGPEAEFSFLAFDTRSPYIDKRPNLEEGVPEKREYYAYLYKDDQQVGDPSPIVSVKL